MPPSERLASAHSLISALEAQGSGADAADTTLERPTTPVQSEATTGASGQIRGSERARERIALAYQCISAVDERVIFRVSRAVRREERIVPLDHRGVAAVDGARDSCRVLALDRLDLRAQAAEGRSVRLEPPSQRRGTC